MKQKYLNNKPKKANKLGKTTENIKDKVEVDLTQTQGLTCESIKKEGLKKNRGSLSSSLIGFSINDVTRTHRVKSEFNTCSRNNLNAGQMFSCLDATMKIGGLLGEDLLKKEIDHNDNRSCSALSFTSGGIFNPLRNTISGLSMHSYRLDKAE
jgi:hypothetical protein